MANAKHTPGPWEAVAATAPEGAFSYWLCSPSCGAVGYWCGHKSNHTEADANLIAAAPDMLEALIRLDAFWLEAHPAGPNGDPSYKGFAVLSDDTLEIWRGVRAAISKAKGGA